MIPDPDDENLQIKEKDYFCTPVKEADEPEAPSAQTGGKWVAQWIPDDGPAGDIVDIEVTEDQQADYESETGEDTLLDGETRDVDMDDGGLMDEEDDGGLFDDDGGRRRLSADFIN